ncbi:MAG TPA: hypothetical protein VK557_18360 [Pyrinomonadaceae bacterium]|nr:hypothetical protein [Pyrinomonadaceae bacterium]
MNVELKAVRNAGDLDHERVVLRVRLPDDIGLYVIGDSESIDPESISGRLHRMFWFPDGRVSAGDLVILYSKKGKDKAKKNKSGSTSHFYYWGFTHPIWNEPDSAAVLIKIKDFTFKILADPTEVDEIDTPQENATP